MTEITRKTSYVEAKTIFEDPSSTPELKTKAKERMDSIKQWLDKKKGSSGDSKLPPAETIKLDKLGLDAKTLEAIKKDTEERVAYQLARLYYLRAYLQEQGLPSIGPFSGMLFNDQQADRRQG